MRPTPASTLTRSRPLPAASRRTIITHNAKILEGLQVDYVHVLDDARIVRTGDGSLVNEIIEEGFTALKEDEAK